MKTQDIILIGLSIIVLILIFKRRKSFLSTGTASTTCSTCTDQGTTYRYKNDASCTDPGCRCAQQVCGSNSSRDPSDDTKCTCNPGFVLINGACVAHATCGTHQTYDAKTNICTDCPSRPKPGQIWDASDSPCGIKTCPANSHENSDYSDCVCNGGYIASTDKTSCVLNSCTGRKEVPYNWWYDYNCQGGESDLKRYSSKTDYCAGDGKPDSCC